ncbi:hypothetical protein MTsPCn3_31200 [Erythrobacter sp. MTPC3]
MMVLTTLLYMGPAISDLHAERSFPEVAKQGSVRKELAGNTIDHELSDHF